MYQDFSFAELRYAYHQVVRLIENHQRCHIHSCRQYVCRDLGIFGDDNEELIDNFVEKFDLDTESYVHMEHFLSEGEGYPIALSLWFSLFLLPIFIVAKFWIGATIALINALYMGYLNKNKRNSDDVHDMQIKDMIRWYLYKTYQPQESK